MAEADLDAGDALRRSLGLKPRSRPEPGSAAEVPDRAAPDARRAERPASGSRRSAAQRAADGEPEAPRGETDPRKKPVGKLPRDAQLLLRNYYLTRPDVDLPPFLHQLEGTLGRYFGDGTAGREIKVGFRPEFVLFTLPTYPDEQPVWDKDEGMVQPGLHAQPETTDLGFLATENVNRLGEMVIYLAWKAEGPRPVPVEKRASSGVPGESPRDARRREQREQRARELEERRARARKSKR